MNSDFLQLAGKRILVMGVANKKSVAWHAARVLVDAGAEVVYAVRSEARREQVQKLVGDAAVFVCDVEFEDQITNLASDLAQKYDRLDGFLHSIAFADYAATKVSGTNSSGAGGSESQTQEMVPDTFVPPFHETAKRDFLRAFDISCFSLVAVSNALKNLFAKDASVVTVSISTTTMASENYGYMAPIKAALDSSLAFLAKSFSRFSHVRFNAVAPGLLKTSASAGIPGYVDSYLYAEQATLRKKAVQTEEAAHVAAFLLSPRSSGVNAQRIVVDAGMSTNYFDASLVQAALRGQ